MHRVKRCSGLHELEEFLKTLSEGRYVDMVVDGTDYTVVYRAV